MMMMLVILMMVIIKYRRRFCNGVGLLTQQNLLLRVIYILFKIDL